MHRRTSTCMQLPRTWPPFIDACIKGAKSKACASASLGGTLHSCFLQKQRCVWMQQIKDEGQDYRRARARRQLAGKPNWVWGCLMRSTSTTSTSTSHSRPHILPAGLGKLRGAVGHVHAAPVTSASDDVTMLLTHPGDTSHLGCCRLLERQLTNLRRHLFSLICIVAFSFFKFYICCSCFDGGTWELVWQQRRPTPPPTYPPTQPDLQGHGAGLGVVAILWWHAIDWAIFRLLPKAPLPSVACYYGFHPPGAVCLL